MINNTQDIRILLEIAKWGSFLKAAKALKLDPSTISKTVSKIEDILGVALFTRTSRTLKLTEHGQDFIKQMKPLLERWDQVFFQTQQNKIALEGSLTIAAPVAYGNSVVSQLVLEFQKQNPHIQFYLNLNNSIQDLSKDGIDLAFRIIYNNKKNVAHKNVYTKKLHKVSRYAYAHESYLLQNGTPKTPTKLKDHQLIVYEDSNGKVPWNFENTLSSVKSVNESYLSSNNSEFIYNAVAQGHGIGLLPEYMVETKNLMNGVKKILPKYKVTEGNLYLIYKERLKTRPTLKAFVEFLQNKIV